MYCYYNKCSIYDDTNKYAYNISYNFLLLKLEFFIGAKIEKFFYSASLINIINAQAGKTAHIDSPSYSKAPR